MNSIQTFVLVFGDKYIPNIIKLHRTLYTVILYHTILIITNQLNQLRIFAKSTTEHTNTQVNTNLLTDATLGQTHTKAIVSIYIPSEISNPRLLIYFIIFALYISLSSDGKTLYHLVNVFLSALGTKSVVFSITTVLHSCLM